jgi:hypothetical protein
MALLALTELMKLILKLTNKKRDDLDESMHQYHIISKALFEAIGKAINAQIIFDFEEELLRAREFQYAQQNLANTPTGEPSNANPVQKNGKKPMVKPEVLATKTAALAKRVLKKKLTSDVHQSIGMPK